MILAGFSSWGLLATSRSGNAPELPPTATNPNPTPSITPNQNASVIDKSNSSPVSVTQNPANTVTLSIYQADSQCETLIPEKVDVPTTNSANAAVGKVLEQVNSSDFELAGYRVNLNSSSGVATIDLRLSPDSRRHFASLSTCERFALFGSLRKTLIENSPLKIKEVRFTEQGQEIYL
ncbi:sporulation/spore germination protein [Coleofasciculus sp. LEGE 07081]|nr:sporulation/spore germination protein [Coleofasciculus sp. LEGE 07081]